MGENVKCLGMRYHYGQPCNTMINGVYRSGCIYSSEIEKECERQQLLQATARKPLRELMQIDCWNAKDICDSVVRPDQDGDWICWGETKEFRNSDDDLVVRIHFPVKADRKQAA